MSKQLELLKAALVEAGATPSGDIHDDIYILPDGTRTCVRELDHQGSEHIKSFLPQFSQQTR